MARMPTNVAPSSRFDRDKPFNELPALPPPIELESKAVLKRVIAARTALADLKGAGSLIPDQAILVRTLGLQEARLSSEIENVVTTSDQLYRALADDARSADVATREVLAYARAVERGCEAVRAGRPLATGLFEKLASMIRETDARVRRMPGTKLANPATGKVVYTPPDGERRLRDLHANLENFLHADDDLDPLVRMAVAHYQFEAIHPFTDGNGRTGRILNILILIQHGLLDIPVLFLSRFILERKNDYYRLLREVTERDAWEAWILYMLEAVETTSRETHDRIRAIRDLMDEWIERVRTEKSKIYSRELIELVFRNPYSKIRFIEEAGIARRATASRYLHELADLGLLQPIQRGRDVYFLNEPLVRLLAR
jgi:Fic family protein